MSRRDIDAIEQELIALKAEVRQLQLVKPRQTLYENGFPVNIATEYITPAVAPAFFFIPLHLVNDMLLHRVQLVARAGGTSAITKLAIYSGGASFHEPWDEVSGAQSKRTHELRLVAKADNGITVDATAQVLTYDFAPSIELKFAPFKHYFAVLSTDVTTLRLAVAERTLIIGASSASPVATDGVFATTLTMPSNAVPTPYIRLQSVVGSRMDSGI